MGVIRIGVKIGAVVAPPGRTLDLDDLRGRVEAELAELLAREPLPTLPADGVTICVPSGAVRTTSLASAAPVAHAIARHVHDGLRLRREGT